MRRRISIWLGVLGMLLMPFSTSPEDGGVLAFGLPFILLAVVLGIDLVLAPLQSSRGLLRLVLVIAALVAVAPVPFTLLSPQPDRAFLRAAVYLLSFAFGLWALGVGRHRGNLDSIRSAFTAFGLVLAAYYIFNFAWRANELGIEVVALERYVGGGASLPWSASNAIAGTILLPFVAYLAIGPGAQQRWWERLFPYIGFLGITMTFSRAGILLALLSLLVLTPLRSLEYSRRLLAGVTLVVGLAVYVLAVVGTDAAEQLFTDRLDPINIETGNSRIDIWVDRLRLVPDALLDPLGYYSSLYLFDNVSPHNYYITTALEQGLPGLLLNVAMAVLLLAHFGGSAARRAGGLRRTGFALRFVWLVVIAHGMVEDLNFIQPYCMAYWLLFAITLHCWESETRPRGLRSAADRSWHDRGAHPVHAG